jgi:antitoxin CptB
MDDVRRKRARYRAWHRGFREADLILGPFADRYCPEFSEEQLDAFERLLELPDPDLYGWIVGAIPTPPEHDGEILNLLKAFKPHG